MVCTAHSLITAMGAVEYDGFDSAGLLVNCCVLVNMLWYNALQR